MIGDDKSHAPVRGVPHRDLDWRDRPFKHTQKLMITRREGEDWEIIEVHSMVTPDGMRWDAHSGWTGLYSHTPDEIEENQRNRR